MKLPVEVEVTGDPSMPNRAVVKFRMKGEFEHIINEICTRYHRRPLDKGTKDAIAADIERALIEYMRDD